MTFFNADKILLERVCLGNAEAIDFLANHWAPYCHEVDDIIDRDRTGSEEILSTFARAIILYSHPFYLRNIAALRAVALATTNTYADSVSWERSAQPHQREWADFNRHVGMDMVIAVAQVCGGYDHGRSVSQELRETCFAEHPHKATTYDETAIPLHHRQMGSYPTPESPTRRNGD